MNAGGDGRGCHWTDARNGHQAARHIISPGDGFDLFVRTGNLFIETFELPHEWGQGFADEAWQTVIAGRDTRRQFPGILGALRCDYADFRQMAA